MVVVCLILWPVLDWDIFWRCLVWCVMMLDDWNHFHRRAIALPCVNGDGLSQWRMAKFDSSQIRDPSTDRHKIRNRWSRGQDDPLCKISWKSVHWGLFGIGIRYNWTFSHLNILFLMAGLPVRPIGGFLRTMAQTTRSHARVCLFRGRKFKVNI